MDAQEATKGRQGSDEVIGNLLSSFQPEEILQSITSAAIYYCAKGFDAFDEVLLTSEDIDKETLHKVLEASVQTYAQVLDQLQKHLTIFQRDALATALSIPQPPISEHAEAEMADVGEADEELLDKEIEDLVKKIIQVKSESRTAQSEAVLLKQEMEQYGSSTLPSVAAPLLVGKENLSQDAEAIFAQATKLAPLLSRAEQVMQKHRESKGALSFQSATSLAEKEFVARQAAAKGLLAEDLERLRLTLVPDHQGTQPAQL